MQATSEIAAARARHSRCERIPVVRRYECCSQAAGGGEVDIDDAGVMPAVENIAHGGDVDRRRQRRRIHHERRGARSYPAGKLQIEFAEIVLIEGIKIRRGQQQRRHTRLSCLARQFERVRQRRATYTRQHRQAAALHRQVRQSRALVERNRRILTGRHEQRYSGNSTLTQKIQEFKRGAEINFVILTARCESRGNRSCNSRHVRWRDSLRSLYHARLLCFGRRRLAG